VLTSVGIPTDFNAIPIDFVKQRHLLRPLREQKESLDLSAPGILMHLPGRKLGSS